MLTLRLLLQWNVNVEEGFVSMPCMWDARYDVKRVFTNCDLEWRIREKCVNPHCERDYNKKDRLPSVVPADEIDTGAQEANISERQPVCGLSPLWDVRFGVEPAIHSLMKGYMSAYYM
jgi:hypothetical protein